MSILDRTFPPDQCEPMVGVPSIYAAAMARSAFILDGLTVVDNDGIEGLLAWGLEP